MAGCRKADGDDGYTFLSVLIAMSISMVMLAVLWTMVMRRVDVAQVTSRTGKTLQIAMKLPEAQVVTLQEAVEAQQGMIVNGLQPYLAPHTTTSQVIVNSKELRLLAQGLVYQGLVESGTTSTIYGPVFNMNSAPTQMYTYKGMNGSSENFTTYGTNKVLFRESLSGGEGTTLKGLRQELTDYSKVRDALSTIRSEVAKGTPLTNMTSSFSILEKELEKKAPCYIYTLCETKERKADGSEVVYDRQISYQLMKIVVSDDFQLEVSKSGSQLLAGKISIEKAALCMERIP